MNSLTRKTLDQLSDESEHFEAEFERWRAGAPDQPEWMELVSRISTWMQDCARQGCFIPLASAERRAFRSLLEHWSSRLRGEGHYIDGVAALAEFDPKAGMVLAVPCPYPGLEPYTQDRRASFFGRDAQIESFVTHLEQPGSRIVLIVGASGCGKSSLALAGVMPKMAERHDEWLFGRPMTPGTRPVAELATVVAEAAGQPSRAAEFEAQLRSGPAQALPLFGAICNGLPLVLFVDQFEELLTTCKDTAEQEAFAAALYALTEPGAFFGTFCCRVLVTLRTDHLARFEGNSALKPLHARLVDEGNQRHLPTIGFEDIKRAIKEPADRVGLRFVPARLIDQLASQTAGLAAGLPLLQFALRRLWDSRPRNDAGQALDLITAEMVEQLPDVERALGRLANQRFEALSRAQQKVCERLLLELVVLDETFEEPLRRRRNETDVTAALSRHFDAADIAKVIGDFVDAGLLRRFGVAPANQLEVAHEALLRHWDHIYQLVTGAEVKQRLHLIKQVDREARDWVSHGKADDYLNLKGERLKQAVRDAEDGWLADAEITKYIDASRARELADAIREKQAQEEKRRAADAEQRAVRAGRWVIAATATVIVLAGVVAWGLYQERIGFASEFAMTARAELEKDPARSAHLALAAVDLDAKNTFAQYMLRSSLAVLDVAHAVRIVDVVDPIRDVGYSSDRSRLIVATENAVVLLDAKSHDRIGKIPFDSAIDRAWLVAGNQLLIAKTSTGSGTEVRTVGGELLPALACSRPAGGDQTENGSRSAAVSPDGRFVAVGCYDGEVNLWTVNGRGPLWRTQLAAGLKGPVTVTALAFSSDSAYLATGTAAGAVQIWKVGGNRPLLAGNAARIPVRHADAIRDIAFYPGDSTLLATASDDKSATVWMLEDGNRRARKHWPLKRHDRPVVGARFEPRGADRLLLTISDKRVRIWLSEEDRTSRNHDDWVNDARTSANGEYLVSASEDGTARVWSTRSLAPLAVLQGHRGGITRAMFVPGSNDEIITVSSDGTLRVWLFRPPRLLAYEYRKWILGAAFEPGYGKRVAWCGERTQSNYVCTVQAPVDLADRENEALQLFAGAGTSGVSRISWSHDGRYLAGLTEARRVTETTRPIVWDLTTGKEIMPTWLEGSLGRGFSASAAELVTVEDSAARRIMVWDTAALATHTATPKQILDKPPEPMRQSAALSPDGRWIAAIAGNKVRVWPRSPTNEQPVTFTHEGDIHSVVFSNNGKWLATASSDRTARVWALTTAVADPEPTVTFKGHTSSLSTVAFNPDATLVATGGADGTIRVWDVGSGRALAVLRWHGEVVNDVQFSPDGRSILSASDDGTVRAGQCEACTLPLTELRKRVETMATLSKLDKEELRQVTRPLSRWLKRPEFFSTGETRPPVPGTRPAAVGVGPLLTDVAAGGTAARPPR